jgi:hypothetical protein
MNKVLEYMAFAKPQVLFDLREGRASAGEAGAYVSENSSQQLGDAIAGLLDHVGQEDTAAIPILSQIPVLGNLFKTKARREDRTELMVLITPRLVRALNPDEVPPLPSIIKPPTGGRGGGSGTVAEQVQGGAGLVDAPPQASATKKDAPAVKKETPPASRGGR